MSPPALALVAACASPPRGGQVPPRAGAVVLPAAPPILGPAATVVDAACAPDPDNALRATCTVELSAPGVAVVEVGDGRESARFRSREIAVTHEIPVWGLTAATTWRTAAGAEGDAARVEGELVTGALPPALAFRHRIEAPGASRLVHVLLPASCDTGGVLVALDGEGRVRWYEDVARTARRRWMEGFQYTEDGTVLAVTGRGDALTEVDLSGATLWRKTDFDLPVHHDVARRDGRTYLLQADVYEEANGVRYVEDLVTTLDRDHAEIGRWAAHDHLDATAVPPDPDTEMWDEEFPGATDAWHTNGVTAGDDGDLLVSMLGPSAVLRISGDTGDVRWTLVGPGHDTTLAGDLELVEDAGDPRFRHQHQPRFLPDGTIGVFDNQGEELSRGLALRVDEAAGTATFVDAWPMGLRCGAQSSVFELADGHHLLTCAPDAVIVELDADDAEVWRAELGCESGAALPLVVRGQPLDLWTAGTDRVTVSRVIEGEGG